MNAELQLEVERLGIDLRIVAKPTAGKSSAEKPGDDVRTASHQLPNEF